MDTREYKLSVQLRVDPRADSARKDVRTLLFESVRASLNAVKYAQTDRVALALGSTPPISCASQ
jgi:hypothetical protein